MNNLIVKPYEISLWDDILTFVLKKPNSESLIESEEPLSGYEVQAQYYKEKKVAIIGSNTMDTPIRAFQPQLITNINGSSTFSFSMYFQYYDSEQNIFLENPFIKMLTNERKIKVHYNDQWYDFVIKDIKEDSVNKTFTYTAKDLFINELSKTGFNLQFDTKLKNNIGTIDYLANQILKDTDWELKNSNKFYQTKEEPLYEVVLNTSISGKDIFSSNGINILSGKKIYPFYSTITNEETEFQFLYSPNSFVINEDRLVQNVTNYTITVVWKDNIPYYNGIPLFTNKEVSQSYRGEKFLRKSLFEFDPVLNRLTRKYKDGVYGYEEDEYISPNTIKSYIVNPKDFTSTSGWMAGGYLNNSSVKFPKIEVISYPDVRTQSDESFKALLHYEPESLDQKMYNSGMVSFRTDYDHLIKDQIFICKIKAFTASSFSTYPTSLTPCLVSPSIQIGTWELDKGIYKNIEDYFVVESSENKGGFFEAKLKCLKSVSKEELFKISLGFFISYPQQQNGYYIEEVQFFPYQKIDGEILLPDVIFEPKVKTKYTYYKRVPKAEGSKDFKIDIIYQDYIPGTFQPLFNNSKEDYEKERTLKTSESNRFNLLQELCELFNCWCHFDIQHEKNGQISLDANYKQIKSVSFYDNILQENYAGFKYGINLKAISRTINSDGIVSKIIVKNNSNEFAKNGFCSIVRSEENYCKENFILDFSHYIQQKMMDYGALTQDLFSPSETQGFLGYYTQLKKLNSRFLPLDEEQQGLLTDISNYQANYTKYEEQLKSSEEELRNQKIELKNTINMTYEDFIRNPENSWWNEQDQVAQANSIFRLEKNLPLLRQEKESAQLSLEKAKEKFEKNKQELEKIKEAKLEKHKLFYQKYSRFIQEGSWIDENYIDDTLYYLDAESTLHTSAQPKVSYDIKVLELSQIEGYENYTFQVGDKTTIEDIEFFGWDTTKAVLTPYKEEVVVTEISYSFDQPDQNVVKVQNYKTQFEDLFQRITATTQSIEYSKGSYGKAAEIVKENGSIKADVLQNSMVNNSIRLENAKDQSVVWDETGITSTCLTSPNEMLRIISGGIFISNDGGLKWATGISANGINASYITSGQIDTSVIRVMNGGFPSFRWDKDGLSAYTVTEGIGFDFNKFVRFDQFGIYGVNSKSSEKFVPKNQLEIREKADFALMWNGFYLKSKHNKGGYISLSSDKDFEIYNDKNNLQIAIGLLDRLADDSYYGLQINDSEGIPILETGKEGDLWLRQKISFGKAVKGKGLSVQMGFLTAINSEGIHEVFNANDLFVIYEDGSIRAEAGEFSGRIEATSGTIGGLNVTENGLKILGENGETKLSFDKVQGLTIYDNLFQIYRDKEKILYVDDDGMHYKGKLEGASGSFSGQIIAETGNFTGKVYVGDSSLDEVANPRIIIDGEEGCIKSSNYDPINLIGFLLSQNGKISSGSLSIGDAEIFRKIKVGDSFYITHPDEKNNYTVLSIQKDGKIPFSLTTGRPTDSSSNQKDKHVKLQVGNIILNGSDSSMFGNGWSITEDVATFNNAVISGKIKTAIFEKNEISCVSGTLLVRPTTKIKDSADMGNGYLAIVPEDPISSWKVNSICKIKNEIFKFLGLNQTRYIFQKIQNTYNDSSSQINNDSLIGQVIVNYGKSEEDVGIAINASENEAAFPKGAISIFQTEITEKGSLNILPKVILGQMDGRYGNLYGYGLYADNVFLKGQLISTSPQQGQDQYYSGINTLSDVLMPNPNGEYFPSFNDQVKKVGNIIFWAGARDSADIINAPFKVDTYGNLFASSGYFKGTIISEAMISAAKIQTAILEGNGLGQQPALKITQINPGAKAIEFEDKMSLTSDNLELDIPIYFSNNLELFGRDDLLSITTNKNNIKENLLLSPNQIVSKSVKQQFVLSFEKKDIAKFTPTSFSVNGNCNFENNISYGNNILKYQKVVDSGGKSIGYDLYIKE